MSDVAQGILAEVDGPEALAAAVRQAREAGFPGTQAFGPFQMPGVAAALGFRERTVPRIGLVALAIGLVIGFGFQFYGNWSYKLNVGGRPLYPVQSFVLVGLEIGILVSAGALLAGLFLVCRLPRLNHPLFDVERFEHATRDGFFLMIPTGGNAMVAGHARAFLVSLQPRSIVDLQP